MFVSAKANAAFKFLQTKVRGEEGREGEERKREGEEGEREKGGGEGDNTCVCLMIPKEPAIHPLNTSSSFHAHLLCIKKKREREGEG